MIKQQLDHQQLSCGITLLTDWMPDFHTATIMMRLAGGMVSEPVNALGLAHVISATLRKGTQNYDERALAQAFDQLGVRPGVSANTQSWVVGLSTLPEHLPKAIELLGEMLLRPTFADDAVQTVVSLTQQELMGLSDSGRAILRRQMSKQVFGPLLGRHPLGNEETLANITAKLAREHWQHLLSRQGTSVAIAGKFDKAAVSEALERAFAPLPSQTSVNVDIPMQFSAINTHCDKDLEQTQIGISFPGVPFTDPEQAVERVMLSVLSGGSGARLFTEVREKQGLVYWVSAWSEVLRGAAAVHLGAATTPQRCEQTYHTLLREVARLEADLTEDELARAKVSILAQNVTTGASAYSRTIDLLVDHFFTGHIQTMQERNTFIERVSIADIKKYLQSHPRDALSVVTVGPQPLAL